MRSADNFDRNIRVSFSPRTEKGSTFHILFITSVGKQTFKKLQIFTVKQFKKLVFFQQPIISQVVDILGPEALQNFNIHFKIKGSNVQMRQFAFEFRKNAKFL